jgi:hypothetical protein
MPAATDAAAEQPTIRAAPVEATIEEPASEAPSETSMGLSGEDFIAQADSLSGTTVTLAKCSLMTEPSPEGVYACRLVDADDSDLHDSDGLPVDVFFSQADLSADMATWITENCPDSFCLVQLSGTLNVSPETFFLEMSDVSLAAVVQ